MISVDIETFDPDLIEMGPSVYRGTGYIVGVGIVKDDGFSHYYNVGHRGIADELKKKNMAIVKELLGTEEEKVFANAAYDMDWLENWAKVPVRGYIHDVQIAEPLLDEYKMTYSLDTLANQYLGIRKGTDKLKEWCEKQGIRGIPASNIYQMPEEVVAPYCLLDAELTLQIIQKQLPEIARQDLTTVYEMECALVRTVLRMRRQGVPINRTVLKKNAEQVKGIFLAKQKELVETYGKFNYNSTKQLAEKFDELGISYPQTELGNPSIKKDHLEAIDHPIGALIKSIKESYHILNTFLLGAFVDYDTKGRIHCQFFPLKRDDGGTVSGRFSSQNPNLQQVPKREDAFGSLCREVFYPEEGHWWGKIDYSQIEYRFIAHYSAGPRSDLIKRRYNEDPKTDYHQFVMDLTGVDRNDAKRLNFGMAYFMGAASMSRKFGWDIDRARDLIEIYFSEVPFLKPTRANVVSIAKGRGYIRTIMGRRARISDFMKENKKEYVMFNRLIQGSAADLMKKAMVDAEASGVFNTLKLHTTVHDELGLSVPKTREGVEAYEELKNVMEQALHLRVPIIAEADIGDSWGGCESANFKELKASV